MSPWTLRKLSLALAAASFLASACADPQCPDGYEKIRNACRHTDGGEAVNAGEGGAKPEVDDTNSSPDSGVDAAGGSSALEAGLDAAGGPVVPVADASPSAPGAGDAARTATDAAEGPADTTRDAAPAPECDGTHACAAGYVCSANKCVTACTQTQCDPNATCSLMANAPVCTCNGGFASMKASDGKITCIRDLKCEELGCDRQNGACVGDTAQTRHCECKNGFTGDGKSCTPVSCPLPTLANGTVSTREGLTFGKSATYQCNAGYDFPSKVPSVTRMCGADKSWGAAVPDCTPKDCGAPEVPRLASGMASGKVSTPGGTAFGAHADYQCNSGLSLSGSAQRTCQATGWSGSVPKCSGCGDGIVDVLTEECDLSAPGSSVWTCGDGCKKKTIYNKCKNDSGCSAGEGCHFAFFFCTKTCSLTSDCPYPPVGTRSCDGKLCYAAGCKTRADCPANTDCLLPADGSPGRCVTCENQPTPDVGRCL